MRNILANNVFSCLHIQQALVLDAIKKIVVVVASKFLVLGLLSTGGLAVHPCTSLSTFSWVKDNDDRHHQRLHHLKNW